MATVINSVSYDVDPASIERLVADNSKTLIKTISGDKLSFSKSTTHTPYRKSTVNLYGITFSNNDPIDSTLLKLLTHLYESQSTVTFQLEEWNRYNGRLTLLGQEGTLYYYGTHMFPVINLDQTTIVINNDVIGDTTVTIESVDTTKGLVCLKSEKLDLTFAKVYATYDVEITAYVSKLDFENIRSYNELYGCNLVLEQLVYPQ